MHDRHCRNYSCHRRCLSPMLQSSTLCCCACFLGILFFFPFLAQISPRELRGLACLDFAPLFVVFGLDLMQELRGLKYDNYIVIFLQFRASCSISMEVDGCSSGLWQFLRCLGHFLHVLDGVAIAVVIIFQVIFYRIFPLGYTRASWVDCALVWCPVFRFFLFIMYLFPVLGLVLCNPFGVSSVSGLRVLIFWAFLGLFLVCPLGFFAGPCTLLFCWLLVLFLELP